MGRIVALVVSMLVGSVGSGATTDGSPTAPDARADFSPHRITDPKNYLSSNPFCLSVSNGCIVCYRDMDAIECTSARDTCTPRRAFRCNRF